MNIEFIQLILNEIGQPISLVITNNHFTIVMS